MIGQDSKPPLQVLFITAFGRSGTTLLDNVLGQAPGFFSLGETQFVWDRSLRDNRLCGCGQPFRDCEVWGPVAAEALDDLTPADVEEMIRIRDALGSARLVLRSWRGAKGVSADIRRYADRLQRLYGAVQRVTGCRVLIDSSKSPSHGYVLDQMAGVDLEVVHMVRNPRAVAYSWRKRKVYDPGGDEPMYMARLSLRQSGMMWLKWNLVSELLWRRRKNYRRLRYEDFVSRPLETADSILESLGGGGAELPFVDSHTVELAANHCLAGNPTRFRHGPVAIRRDEEWQQEMPAWERLAVVGWTWPLLARYGYLS
jgi:Sulfotransferase family